MSEKQDLKMSEQIFSEETDSSTKKIMLEANCLAIEERPVKHYYDENAMQEMRKEFVENSIKISRELDKFEEVKAEMKAIVNPLKEQNQYLQTNMREGYNVRDEKVYKFPFHEIGMIGYYSEKGELVEGRKMRPEERLNKVIPMNGKTNNG